MQGDESDIRCINPESGAVLERLEMPRGTGVSGLESTGQTSFIAAAERAERSAPCDLRCAGLMAILLVLGVMDLRAMAVVAAAITVERLAPASERVARAMGAVIVGAGLFLIARAAGLG